MHDRLRNNTICRRMDGFMKLAELSEELKNGNRSSSELTAECLAAIAENDQDGKKLNTVSEINPNALFEARAADEELNMDRCRSPLHGVPVLIKDNIDVKGLHTTAGSYALNDLIAREDAFLVRRLKEAGAVILGKANLSEFAYFMSRSGMPSGYSSRSGQVVHAYAPGFDPSGSSSGSAVAVSARFVPYAIGTETDGSLMSPSIANAIVSIKPTVGLVSRQGILPISHVQDTAGPMATGVEDAAVILSVIAGKDEADPASWNCRTKDYISALSTDCRGLRIGLFDNRTDERDREALKKAKAILEAAGAEVTELTMEETLVSETEALIHEFRQGINLYLSSHDSSCRNLTEIIRFNRKNAHRCLKYGQDLLIRCDAESGTLKESEYIRKRLELEKASHRLLDGTLKQYGLDCLITAGSRVRTNLAPVSGNPCMTIPAAEPDESDYHPLSYYLMAGPYDEDILIHVSYTLEQALQLNCRPSWVKSTF